MTLQKANPETILAAAAILRKGGLVAFPTETVYGLGADALNPAAVARIFEVKNRPFFDPLIVHTTDRFSAGKFADVSELAARLMENFWPGPLTLVMKKKEGVPDLVTSGLPTVAIRVPSHPVALALLRAAGCPIAAPSANPFGFLSPTTAEHVEASLGSKVDSILDGGACLTGVESTIVDVSGAKPVLLRPGGLTAEEIEKITGPLETSAAVSKQAPKAPGQLEQHYAPRLPLEIMTLENICGDSRLQKAGVLLWKKAPQHLSSYSCEVLSPEGSLNEAAQNLFAALHRLDQSGAELILAEPVPESGLGRAIMDRLRRAAHSEPLKNAE